MIRHRVIQHAVYISPKIYTINADYKRLSVWLHRNSFSHQDNAKSSPHKLALIQKKRDSCCLGLKFPSATLTPIPYKSDCIGLASYCDVRSALKASVHRWRLRRHYFRSDRKQTVTVSSRPPRPLSYGVSCLVSKTV